MDPLLVAWGRGAGAPGEGSRSAGVRPRVSRGPPPGPGAKTRRPPGGPDAKTRRPPGGPDAKTRRPRRRIPGAPTPGPRSPGAGSREPRRPAPRSVRARAPFVPRPSGGAALLLPAQGVLGLVDPEEALDP